jgi:ATP adenylyltransferase
MDYIWSPWRYRYVAAAGKTEGCIFCTMAAADRDEDNLIVFRGSHNFVVLNRYPYTSGHVMVVPYRHTAELSSLDEEAAAELMRLTRAAERHLRTLYRPDGLNLGMNLGASAGAGIADHIHMHVLPRWLADANFISVIGETRVLPENLSVSWRRIHDAFKAQS